MKEFDYEKAKAGHPVRTRDGREVEIFKWDAKSNFPIFGMIKGKVEDIPTMWRENGRWRNNEWIDNNDLMLAPKKVEKWMNVYRQIPSSEYIITSCLYDTKEKAKADIYPAHLSASNWKHLATVKVEWEE